jgi:hypothetical protein
MSAAAQKRAAEAKLAAELHGKLRASPQPRNTVETGSRTRPRVSLRRRATISLKTLPLKAADCQPAAPVTVASDKTGSAIKHFYIDALSDRNDTRETLLRYTFKCHPVNVLIGGNLWNSKGSPAAIQCATGPWCVFAQRRNRGINRRPGFAGRARHLPSLHIPQPSGLLTRAE